VLLQYYKEWIIIIFHTQGNRILISWPQETLHNISSSDRIVFNSERSLNIRCTSIHRVFNNLSMRELESKAMLSGLWTVSMKVEIHNFLYNTAIETWEKFHFFVNESGLTSYRLIFGRPNLLFDLLWNSSLWKGIYCRCIIVWFDPWFWKT